MMWENLADVQRGRKHYTTNDELDHILDGFNSTQNNNPATAPPKHTPHTRKHSQTPTRYAI